MPASSAIQQSLGILLPSHAAKLPSALTHVSESLLAQSRQRASHLKPDEEIARAYACCEIACKRLRAQCRLPAVKAGGAPCKPAVYKKLVTFLERVLDTDVTSSIAPTPTPNTKSKSSTKTKTKTSTTGRGGRSITGLRRNANDAELEAELEAAGNEFNFDATPTPSPSKKPRNNNNTASITGQKAFLRATLRKKNAASISAQELEDGTPREAPAFVVPAIRKLCSTFDTPLLAPHVYTGTCIVLNLTGLWPPRDGEDEAEDEAESENAGENAGEKEKENKDADDAEVEVENENEDADKKWDATGSDPETGPASGIGRRGHTSSSSSQPRSNETITGLLIALYLMTLTRMQTAKMTTSVYKATCAESVQLLSYHPGPDGVEEWIRKINREGYCRGQAWWASVPESVFDFDFVPSHNTRTSTGGKRRAVGGGGGGGGEEEEADGGRDAHGSLRDDEGAEDDDDEDEDRIRSTTRTTRRTDTDSHGARARARARARQTVTVTDTDTVAENEAGNRDGDGDGGDADPDAVLLPGLATMMQPAVDFTSEDRTQDFDAWKRSFLRKLDRLDKAAAAAATKRAARAGAGAGRTVAVK